MAKRIGAAKRRKQFISWLLQEDSQAKDGPYRKEEPHHKHAWWRVMCLTGVDYLALWQPILSSQLLLALLMPQLILSKIL